MNFEHSCKSKRDLRAFTNFIDNKIGTEYSVTLEEYLTFEERIANFNATVVVFDLELREEVDLIINFLKNAKEGHNV